LGRILSTYPPTKETETMTLLNRVTHTWNGSEVLRASCTAVMAHQLLELAAQDFAGDTRALAMRELFDADLLSRNLAAPLPSMTFRWRDETGKCVVKLNAD
jgi:hypothetical protein